MLSIKPIVYKHYRRADGLFPVKIRVTYRQQTRYFDTPLVATRKQLTKDLNNIADYRLFMAAAKVAEQMRDTLNANVLQINTIADVQRIVNVQAKPLPTVADFGRELADRWTADHRQHTAANYRTAIARLDEFAPRCQFAAVSVPFLQRYEAFLRSKVGSRGVQMYLSCLRKIYNAAIDEFNADGAERIRRSPFEHYKIPEPEPTKKRALTVEQLRQIADCQTPDPIANFGRDIFLLSFAFCGINTVDLYSLTELTDTALTYNRSKTKGKRRDRALLTVAVHPFAADLCRRYADPKGKGFAFRHTYSNAENFNKAVNKGLKRIGALCGIDNLQFYAARHTWATIARNDCNVSLDDVAMALCHSRRSVTDIYIRADFSRVDRANDAVLRFCFADRLTGTGN